MKIIHCADLHLDSRMQTNLTKDQAKERKAEILETFLSMIDYAVENNVSAILISGDLFDTKRVSARTKNVVREAVLNNPGIEFYYLKGNHDVSSPFDDIEENNSIPDNLKLFSGEWTSYCPAEGSRIRITGLELGADNAAAAWNTLVLDTECINIVMLHGQETESRSDKTECINLKALRNRGIDYLALGHIHAYKMEKLDSRGSYCYPGCLEGRGFDECGEHGFVLLDIDEAKNDTAERIKKEFVPIAFRRLYCFEMDISGCMSSPEIETKIWESLAAETFEQTDLIKLVLTGRVDVECEKDTDYLLKRLKSLCFYMKIEDESEYAVDYDSFMLDESLKGEFVRTVMAKEDITGEEKARIIRCGIQALRGEN
jgi:DNA repair exonuclease SbcCD nuclease subunit